MAVRNYIMRKRETRQEHIKRMQERRKEILNNKIKRIKKIPNILTQPEIKK